MTRSLSDYMVSRLLNTPALAADPEMRQRIRRLYSSASMIDDLESRTFICSITFAGIFALVIWVMAHAGLLGVNSAWFFCLIGTPCAIAAAFLLFTQFYAKPRVDKIVEELREIFAADKSYYRALRLLATYDPESDKYLYLSVLVTGMRRRSLCRR